MIQGSFVAHLVSGCVEPAFSCYREIGPELAVRHSLQIPAAVFISTCNIDENRSHGGSFLLAAVSTLYVTFCQPRSRRSYPISLASF
jgi:hypothetical protein